MIILHLKLKKLLIKKIMFVFINQSYHSISQSYPMLSNIIQNFYTQKKSPISYK